LPQYATHQLAWFIDRYNILPVNYHNILLINWPDLLIAAIFYSSIGLIYWSLQYSTHQLAWFIDRCNILLINWPDYVSQLLPYFTHQLDRFRFIDRYLILPANANCHNMLLINYRDSDLLIATIFNQLIATICHLSIAPIIWFIDCHNILLINYRDSDLLIATIFNQLIATICHSSITEILIYW
jgi:hypothetical protein